MKVKKTCIFWWVICAAYIAVTYTTLGTMPAIWESFNAFFGGRGVLTQYALYTMAGLWIRYYLLIAKKERQVSRHF